MNEPTNEGRRWWPETYVFPVFFRRRHFEMGYPAKYKKNKKYVQP
jgi:hypothetical protein